MTRKDVQLIYPRQEYSLILQSRTMEAEYYAPDKLEYRKLNIIQAKYGCRQAFHLLPNHISLDLHKFKWHADGEYFTIDKRITVPVQINTLKEAIFACAEMEYYY